MIAPRGAVRQRAKPYARRVRVLIVHNRYRSDLPSGEDLAVDTQADTLTAMGCEVERFERRSDEIADFGLLQRSALPLAPTVSINSSLAFHRRLRDARPDIVHVHNVYPLISPSVIRVAARAGVPVVQTLHNYRSVCMAGTRYRDGADCDLCSTSKVLPGVRHSCYRQSALQSAAMAVSLRAHRRTMLQIDAFVAVSESVKQIVASAGVPRDRVHVIPNSLADRPAMPLGHRFLVAGRIEPEKGVDLALDGWRGAGAVGTLTIAGDGSQRETLERHAPPNTEFVGSVSPERIDGLLDESCVVIATPRWHEPFGLTAIEAFRKGRPVIATRRGGLQSIVDDDVGWLVEPDPREVARAIRSAADRVTVEERAARARHRFETSYSSAAVGGRLTHLYEAILARRSGAGFRS